VVIQNIYYSFSIQIFDDMIYKLVLYVYEEGQRVFGDWNKCHPDSKKIFIRTNPLEIHAFLGVVLTTSAWHENRKSY
jgi:hypothetical protein